MVDLGLTHIALTVRDVDHSIAFYETYAYLQVVHRRTDPVNHSDVAWLSDLKRPFVIVLLKTQEVNHPLLPGSHLGVACKTREEIDHLCEKARNQGILLGGPADAGPPVGYWAFIRDPDGHTLELSYGQDVGLTVAQAADHLMQPLS